MSEDFSLVDWILCGVAAAVALVALYAHTEGNRISATRFVFHDIRREMTNRPAREVWWRAFKIAMGWHKRGQRKSRRRDNVTPISRARNR